MKYYIGLLVKFITQKKLSKKSPTFENVEFPRVNKKFE